RHIQWIALRLLNKEIAPINPRSNVDYCGLEGPLKECVEKLISASGETIQRLVAGKGITNSLPQFLKAIDSLISSDGLSSWVACRCALTLIQFGEGPRIHIQDGERFFVGRKASTLVNVDEWKVMRRHLTPFFRSAISHDLDSKGRTLAGK